MTNRHREAQRKYLKKNPWMVAYTGAKNRCNNPRNHAYARYGGRGIRFLLTKEQIKILWLRDKAQQMRKPSIDRIKNDKDYTLDNCCFIEQEVNCKKDSVKIVLQLTSDNIVIREWSSLTTAAVTLNLSLSKISAVCRGMRHTTGGYRWRFKQ